MGYTHILAFDSVVGADPAAGGADSHTRTSTLSTTIRPLRVLRRVTRRIELVTGIDILPQRQTALVAKQAAAVDVLSGRSAAPGHWSWLDTVEFEALARTSRIAESGRGTARVMRLLGTREVNAMYDGQWHDVPDAGIRPLPVQQPIPVWMEGDSDVVIRRAARLADGSDHAAELPSGTRRPANGGPSPRPRQGGGAGSRRVRHRGPQPPRKGPCGGARGGDRRMARDARHHAPLPATRWGRPPGPEVHVRALERFKKCVGILYVTGTTLVLQGGGRRPPSPPPPPPPPPPSSDGWRRNFRRRTTVYGVSSNASPSRYTR